MKRIRRGFSLLVVLLLSFSCKDEKQRSTGDTSQQSSPVARDSSAHHAAADPVPLNDESETDIEYDTDGYAKAQKISAKSLSFHVYSIPFDFNPDSVLVHFFPGKIYHRPDSRAIFSCWSCSGYKSGRKPPGEDGAWQFPSAKNETAWIDTFSWKQPDGDRYLAFFTQTSEPTEDGSGFCCGRFTPAWVGISIFRAERAQWNMIAYDPAVGSSGQFHTADVPEIIVSGLHSFLILMHDYDRGGGSPTWMSVRFCAVDGNRIVDVSDKMDWGIGNRATEWTTTVTAVDENSALPYPPVLLHSEGHLLRDEEEEIGENLNVPEAKQALQTADALAFTRTQRMEFSKGKYVVVKTEFAADTTWKPKE